MKFTLPYWAILTLALLIGSSAWAQQIPQRTKIPTYIQMCIGRMSIMQQAIVYRNAGLTREDMYTTLQFALEIVKYQIRINQISTLLPIEELPALHRSLTDNVYDIPEADFKNLNFFKQWGSTMMAKCLKETRLRFPPNTTPQEEQRLLPIKPDIAV